MIYMFPLQNTRHFFEGKVIQEIKGLKKVAIERFACTGEN